MSETFTQSDKKQKSVILVEYPRKGVWVVGFATKENKGGIISKESFIHQSNVKNLETKKKEKKEMSKK